jgi:hypothetical protein
MKRNRNHLFIGAHTREVRTAVQLTCGVSRATLYNWQSGITAPSNFQANKISKILKTYNKN